MSIKFAETNQKISEEDLVKFEESHAMKLPEDYRKFLLETNGGIPSDENNCFNYIRRDIRKEGFIDTVMIRNFLGLNQEIYDLGKVHHNLNQKLPDGRAIKLPECLAIADSIFVHHNLGISLLEEKYGEVWLWDDFEPDYEDAWLIANNFTEFLSLLYPCSESLEPEEDEE